MTANGVVQLALYVVVLLALAQPLGAYMARVYEGRRLLLDRVLGWLERLTYRLCGIRADEEMGWKAYTLAMLLFNVLGFLAVLQLLFVAPVGLALSGLAAGLARWSARRPAGGASGPNNALRYTWITGR